MRASLAVVLLSSVATGQVVTVGPPASGATFQEVQAAIDAATPGATIVVLPGTYAPVVVDKPLRILGPGPDAASLASTTAGVEALRIAGLAAGEEVTVSGLDVLGASTVCTGSSPTPFEDCTATVLVQDCLGIVLLHDLRAAPQSPTAATSGDALHVRSSANVVLDSCELRGQFGGQVGLASTATRAAFVEESAVAIIGSELHGGSGIHTFGAAPPGNDGVVARSSTLYVAASTLRGGGGGTASAFGLPFGGAAPGRAALVLEGSIAKLVGGSSSLVMAGPSGCWNTAPCLDGVASIELELGSFVLSGSEQAVEGGPPSCLGGPSCALSLPGAPWSADAGSVFDEIDLVYPTLRASAPRVATGGSFDLDLEGEASSAAAVFVALDLGPGLILPGFDGALSLDAFSLAPLGGVALDASGAGSSTLNVPANPNLANRVLVFQTLNVGAQLVGFSNPTTVVTQ